MNLADLIEAKCVEDARESFWAYRQFINPKLKKGWWQREVARHLQKFAEDLFSGKKPKLVIQAPPQHGKSVQIIDLLSWIAGKKPDIKTIYTSFSDRLGVRANLRLQKTLDSPKFKKIFPITKINEKNSVTISGQYLRNREIIEFIGAEGFFRNTTVRGSITGESLDLGIIDDPIKNREEAESETIRDKTWDWLTDDFFTRFSEDAGLLAILTRWHIDDPIGRLIEIMPDIKVLSYPAIAEKDEEHRKVGEALFPEHKSLEFLLERKTVLQARNFEALYQQNPVQLEGNIFKESWLSYYANENFEEIYQSWDTAIKSGAENDYTACTTWGVKGGQYYLIDALIEKLEFPELLKAAQSQYEKHRPRQIIIEDKASGQQLLQTLRRETRLPIVAYDPTGKGDKVARFMKASIEFEAGRVLFPKAHFVDAVIMQLKTFPNSKNDDIVDSIANFLNWIKESKQTFKVRYI
jgi:predicted phage terminase large subunit-like protein